MDSYQVNVSDDIKGQSFDPEAWHDIDAENHEDACRKGCAQQGIFKEGKTLVGVSGPDDFKHNNGTPCKIHVFTVEGP